MRRLDKTFVIPGNFDVICARGGKAKKHLGNRIFRRIVEERAEEYAGATSKIVKSLIVSSIIKYIRTQSPNGGFVKEMDGVWYEVGDSIAREKIGQALRELNHEKYKSSMTAKRLRWRKERVTAGNDDGGKQDDLGLNQTLEEESKSTKKPKCIR